jgi:hypothetical protein
MHLGSEKPDHMCGTQTQQINACCPPLNIEYTVLFLFASSPYCLLFCQKPLDDGPPDWHLSEL